MAADRIVVIGASMGGIEALCQLLSELPHGFELPLFIVQHIGRCESVLPEIFSRCTPLPVCHPQHGQQIQAGKVYVAPPNQHMVINRRSVLLSQSPRENRSRPAVDPLFRSAARHYEKHVIGVLLGGELDDGVAGLFAIKIRGGLTVVQDPQEAKAPGMPMNAIRDVEVDRILRVKEIASLLTQVSKKTPISHGRRTPKEPLFQQRRHASAEKPDPLHGTPDSMVCPNCCGPLFKLKLGRRLEFHCIAGHSFSESSLSDAHADALERALWVSIRTLREKLSFQRTLVLKHSTAQNAEIARRMAEDVDGIERDVRLLEQIQRQI